MKITMELTYDGKLGKLYKAVSVDTVVEKDNPDDINSVIESLLCRQLREGLKQWCEEKKASSTKG